MTMIINGINVDDLQQEASDALTIISRQRNMAQHEAAMAETRALKAERALEKAQKEIADLAKRVKELAPGEALKNGKVGEPWPSPPN